MLDILSEEMMMILIVIQVRLNYTERNQAVCAWLFRLMKYDIPTFFILEGDNWMTMLLKPSYTAQDSRTSQKSEKVPDSSEEIKSLIRAASAKH